MRPDESLKDSNRRLINNSLLSAVDDFATFNKPFTNRRNKFVVVDLIRGFSRGKGRIYG